ncbi:Glutathione S-transferase [Gracilaria domingensis]|nr:Glutathione S-transferase [Gracilaria domingensis]
MSDYTLYYMPTPNGKKISLALEELQLSYEIKEINIRAGDQFKPDFVAINPNSKIPALVDHTAEGGPFTVFESGAILEYLADKHGKLMPSVLQPRARMAVKQWLYWQMAGFGPMLGQMNFFWIYSKDDIPAGKERYLKEALRLFSVLDKQLESNKFIAGDEYSIADIACYWWSLSPRRVEEVKSRFEEFENIKRWQKQIEGRDAVAKVNAIPFGQS